MWGKSSCSQQGPFFYDLIGSVFTRGEKCPLPTFSRFSASFRTVGCCLGDLLDRENGVREERGARAVTELKEEKVELSLTFSMFVFDCSFFRAFRFCLSS